MNPLELFRDELKSLRDSVAGLQGAVANLDKRLDVCRASCADPRAGTNTWVRSLIGNFITGVAVGLAMLLLKR